MRIDTPRGAGHIVVDRPAGRPAGTTLLFHGAGGDTTAPLIVAVRDALFEAGVTVARFDQPYRVAGRRAPDPAHHLDAAALAAVAALPGAAGGRLVLGGKSSGARVACRIAVQAGAVGVVALGFPLHPPGRPDRSRADELLGAGVPVLVVQGSRDAFGTPDEIVAVAPGVALHVVDGADHGLRDGSVGHVAAAWIHALLKRR